MFPLVQHWGRTWVEVGKRAGFDVYMGPSAKGTDYGSSD